MNEQQQNPFGTSKRVLARCDNHTASAALARRYTASGYDATQVGSADEPVGTTPAGTAVVAVVVVLLVVGAVVAAVVLTVKGKRGVSRSVSTPVSTAGSAYMLNSEDGVVL